LVHCPRCPVGRRSLTMTIRWGGGLRRHKDSSKQAAGTAADEHGSRASEELRERHEAQAQARRELSGSEGPRFLGGGPSIHTGPGW
jgi:hypothetical protein